MKSPVIQNKRTRLTLKEIVPPSSIKVRFQEVDRKLKKEENYAITDKSWKAKKWIIRKSLLFIGDGMSFFGIDDTKLARLKGTPISIWAKFTSFRWVILTFVCWLALIMLLVIESARYGEIKS